jgi:hypothetical protein
VRFDHVITFRDDDTFRPAYLVGEDPDRVHVIVTRGVGETHVVSRPADRVVDYDPPPVQKAGEPGCPWHGDACGSRS